MSATNAALNIDDLITWNKSNAKIWYALASSQPEVLKISCDIHKARTVGELLQHIVAVELRYAERLGDDAVTDYVNIPYGSAEEIFAAHDRAIVIFKELLADEEFDWNQDLEFITLTAGKRRASRKAILHHALLHGIRHYAQLATLSRQQGFKSGPADYLITNSTLVES